MTSDRPESISEGSTGIQKQSVSLKVRVIEGVLYPLHILKCTTKDYFLKKYLRLKISFSLQSPVQPNI